MKFRDYISSYQEDVKKFKVAGYSKEELANYLGIAELEPRSYYKAVVTKHGKSMDKLAISRHLCEAVWYSEKRPYFNVYPIIEKKLMETSVDISMKDLHLPFKTLEIRTTSWTCLASDIGDSFIFTRELPNNEYCEFMVSKKFQLGHLLENGLNLQAWQDPSFGSGTVTISDTERNKCIIVAVGTCLLAKDPNVVKPVVLSKHRDSVTAATMIHYAEKAANRTGRTGFEVGREIERKKAFAHYRNGCLARYSVGFSHDQYPCESDEGLKPIVKWRSGAVVNKSNTPTVPTGFKDATLSTN